MTALGDLPPDTVRALGTRRLDELERQARADGQRWLLADCAPARDKAGVMAAIAAGFGFPAHFGANLDALYDCLTDLEPLPGAASPGLVLVVRHLPDGAGFDDDQRAALLDTFRDAAAFLAGRGVACRVFWSLSRGARPATA